jgi:hypothetical protein
MPPMSRVAFIIEIIATILKTCFENRKCVVDSILNLEKTVISLKHNLEAVSNIYSKAYEISETMDPGSCN